MSESQKVIVTLTTIPSRLHDPNPEGMQACILSLLRQDYGGPYEIHLNIPRVHKHSGEYYRQPDWLKGYKGYKIYTSSTKSRRSLKVFKTSDYGPATKTVPTIARITDPDTVIIVVDDDLVYDPGMVTAQVENQQKYDGRIVGYDGMRSRDDKGNFSAHFGDVRDHFYTSNYRDSRVDILQHYKSVSYKRYYFEEDFFDFIKQFQFWDDDLMIAAYFSYKERERIVTYHSTDTEFKSLEEWQNGGGVTTFPVLRHTNHEAREGCNLFRQAEVPIKGASELYRFVDAGYTFLNK